MRKGLYLAFCTAVISGLANFFNKFALTAVGKNAFQYTTLKNLAVAFFLCVLMFLPWIWPKLAKLSRRDWLNLVLIGFIGGCVPFLLFFQGLSMTSAVSASFIHKTLFVWAAVLAWPLLKEKVSVFQFVALGVLLAGNFLFDGFKGLSWGAGETMIFLATLFWAVENVFAKMVLKRMDSMLLAWGRMFFGSWFLLGFLLISGNTGGLLSLGSYDIYWLALVAVFLSGYVLTWYAALKRLPVIMTAGILVLASPLTAFLNALFIAPKNFNLFQRLGLVLMILAIAIIVKAKKRKIIPENLLNANTNN